MQKNNFLKHFITINSGSLLNMLISLLTTPLITRLVEPSAYGELAVYNIYVNIGMFIFCLGMDQVLVRFFYEHDEIEYRRALLFKCWILPAVVLIITGGCGFIFVGTNLIKINGGLQYYFYLFLGVISQVFYRIAVMVLRLQYKSKSYAVVNCLYKAIYVLLAILLILLIKKDELKLLIIATLGATTSSLLISILIERKLWTPNVTLKTTISYKELLKYGMPFIVSLGVSAFYSAIDKLTIKYFCDYSEVGIYASASSIISIFGIIQSAFNSLWTPMAMERYKEAPDDKEFHIKGYNYITVIMCFFGTSLIVAKDLIVFLLGNNYRQAAFIIPFLTFYPIFYTISETTVSGINFYKKSYMHLIIAIICCLINLGGNILLVPFLGAKGASISTGISYFLLFIMRTLIAKKYYPIKYKLYKLLIILLMMSCFALYNTFFAFTFISLIMYIAILCVILVLYKSTVFEGMKYLKNVLRRK